MFKHMYQTARGEILKKKKRKETETKRTGERQVENRSKAFVFLIVWG